MGLLLLPLSQIEAWMALRFGDLDLGVRHGETRLLLVSGNVHISN